MNGDKIRKEGGEYKITFHIEKCGNFWKKVNICF